MKKVESVNKIIMKMYSYPLEELVKIRPLAISYLQKQKMSEEVIQFLQMCFDVILKEKKEELQHEL